MRSSSEIFVGYIDKGDTALNDAKTAELWHKLAPRYWVTLIVDELRGFQDVPVGLYHDHMPSDEMASLVVLAPNRVIGDVQRWYSGTYILDTFSKAEALQLYSYFRHKSYVRQVKMRRAMSPNNHSIGYEGMQVGGSADRLVLSERAGYSLPFRVRGFYDLRHMPTEESMARPKKARPRP